MTVIDSRGRLFGRFNIVDAAAVILVLGIIPLAYGASLLFRPASPRIDEVGQVDITNAERRIVAGGSLLSAKLKVKGTGFNPMLRAYIGESPALAFVFENPNSADVLVGPMPPGAHDLVLYDGVQEVARAKDAVRIDNPSNRLIQASGWLTNMDPAVANELKVGSTFPPAGETHRIAALGPVRPARSRIRFGSADADFPIDGRVERQAVVILQCDPLGAEFRTGQEPCNIGGQPVIGLPPVTVSLPWPQVTIGFAVDEVFPTTPARRGRIAVRVEAGPEGEAVKVGDRDPLLDARAAVVSGVRSRLVTLDLGLDESREGWRYRGKLVRPGGTFAFATDQYEVSGRVESLTVSGADPPKGRQ